MAQRLGDKGDAIALAMVQSHGGRPTLRDLYARYLDEIVAFVRGKVGDGPPEPEDVAQQAFTNYATLKRPQDVENPRAFLYRTAANIVINHHRHSAYGRKHLAAEKNSQEIFGDHDELSPEIVLLDKERFSHVVAAVRALPRRRRRFLLMHRIEGLNYSEIARRTGVSTSTVRREVEAAVDACGKAVLAAEGIAS